MRSWRRGFPKAGLVSLWLLMKPTGMLKHLSALGFFGILNACNFGGSSPDNRQESSNDQNYAIVYNVLVDSENDDYDVFMVNLDGSGKKNITNHPDVAWTYNAVAEKVLFISDRDTCNRCYFLYEMDADGGNIRKITDFQLRDSWISSRKSGAELIVNPHKKVDSLFYIIDREGEILQKVNPQLVYHNDPAFSPDGTQIVFRGATKAFKKDNGYLDELYIMKDDGTGLKKLTQYPTGDTTAQWYNYHAGPPRWHPNENFISYQSMQEGKYSLYAITPDGSRNWKLTEYPEPEGWHDWSPDGKWLTIGTQNEEQSQYDILLMNWETREVRKLTDTTYQFQQAPAFVVKK